MWRDSLGLIETVGLTAAVEAADAAVKSANVTLAGYELTNGGGLVTVKLLGDVGAVNAAVDAGAAAAERVGTVYARRVIPRPAPALEAMVFSMETKGEPQLGQASSPGQKPTPPADSKAGRAGVKQSAGNGVKTPKADERNK